MAKISWSMVVSKHYACTLFRLEKKLSLPWVVHSPPCFNPLTLPAPPFLFMHNVLSFKAECGMQSNLDDIKNKYYIVRNFICPNFWENSISPLEEIFTVLVFVFSVSYWPSPFIVAGRTTIWTSWKSAAIQWLIKKWMTYQLFWLWFDDQNESR